MPILRCLFVLLVLLAPVRSAHAHAVLLEGQPRVNGTVPAGTVPVVLRFNSRVDAKRSRLLLVRPDKGEQALPLLPDGPDDQLLSQVDLSAGRYTLRWQVLAVDGHITRGDVPFTVAP